MAEQSSSSGGTPWLAFIVGGLVVVAAIIGFMMYSGQSVVPDRSVDVKIEAPQLPEAPKLPDAPLPNPQ
jgi:hypothetical protein